MRKTRRQQFIDKYGPVLGPVMLSHISKVAAQARWKSYYKNR